MLYILFTAIILIPALAGFGAVFQFFFGKFWDGISSDLVAGIFSVSVCFSILAFFIPLNIYVEATTLIIGWVAFFYFKKYNQFWKFLAEQKIGFSILSLVILFFGSYFPFIVDHFGYYVPTIKWISEVSLVKGISNLDLLLGQMSFWHILQAGFSNFSDPFLRLNSVVLIIYLVFIFEKKSWIHLIFLPILFLFSQSPSTDLPVIVFSLIVLNEILNTNKKAGLLFIISVFVFAIKPTMIWLPILSFLYSFFILKSKFKFIFPGLLLLTLFFFKNIFTFGFPVFPVQVLDFGFSWKPNMELLKNSSEMAIQKTYDLQYSVAEIQKFSRYDYIKNWFFLNGIKGKIHFLFIASLVLFFLFTIKKNSKLMWLIFISIFIKSVLVLMFSAQYRFFIDVFFVLFFVILLGRISVAKTLFTFSTLTLVLTLIFCFPKFMQTHIPSFRLSGFMGDFVSSQLYQPSVYRLKNFNSYQIGNLRFNVVKEYPYSFDTPIPAVSPSFLEEDLNAGIFPQLKGKTLKDGFVWKKISEQEKANLRKILDELSKKYSQ